MKSLRVVNAALIAPSIAGEAISYSHFYDISTGRHARNTIHTFVASRVVSWRRRVEGTRVIVFTSKNQFNPLTFYRFPTNITDPTTNASFADQIEVNSFNSLARFNRYAFAGDRKSTRLN